MSAGYAHITLVNELAVSNVLDAAGVHPEAAEIVQEWFKFCELGSVSPDYPYLRLEDKGAQQWADDMHKTRAGEMIHAGITLLKGMRGKPRRKGLAWLLGYAAHVYTDVTVHPVVNLRVGSPYEEHKKDHRECEMHQDVYIYPRLKLGQIGLSEHLESGIKLCGMEHDLNILDQDISRLWDSMFERVYGNNFRLHAPKISEWHKRFVFVIDKIAEEGNRLLPLARHVATENGLVYPSKEDLKMDFIENLATPSGIKHYDAIFDHTKEVVLDIWRVISKAVTGNGQDYLAKIDKNVNLDEGTGNAGGMVTWA
jgi:hypothetical protein